MVDAAAYIAKRATTESGEAAEIINRIKELYGKRLWHQLTEELKKAMDMPSITDKCGLYSEFTKEFEAKLNAVSLIQIVTGASRGELSSKPVEALAFVSALLDSNEEKTVVSFDSEARVLLLSEIATLNLRTENTDACKQHVSAAREVVDASVEMSPVVHSAFYRAAAEYYKVVGPAADFFKNALQFLAYTSAESLPKKEQIQWAFDIGIAALVGSDVYNFGEVISKSIVQVLGDSEHAWLLRLLEAFHEGDLQKFRSVCDASSKQMNDQPALVAHEELIKQKITLLALMQLASTRAETRSITFKEIQTTCGMPPEEVEFLLMRAMSLGLISGTIDNVDEVVMISRVQPRVLDRAAVGVMADRLATWCANVDSTLATMTKNTVTLVE